MASYDWPASGGGSGTVTNLSVATANGFAGTVATATTTPVITLQTTVSGLLLGNGTGVSAASTTGSGAVVLANTPTLITPVLGVATGTSLVLSGNLSANNLINGFTTTATAAGTTTMTIASGGIQVWTGSTTQTVKLPTTGVAAGVEYLIINLSSAAVTVQSSGANSIQVLAANSQGIFTALVATPTAAADWNCAYSFLSGVGGANTALSNLTATAINQNLLPGDATPGATSAHTIGNFLLFWNTVYCAGIATQTPLGASGFVISNNSSAPGLCVFGGPQYGGPMLISTTPGAIYSPVSGDLNIATGDEAGNIFQSDVSSGNVILTTGSKKGTGTHGSVQFVSPVTSATGYITAPLLVNGFTTTATAAGTTTMTVASTGTQTWTGSTTQTVKLPTTSVIAGMQYLIINLSSGVVTVQSSGANTIQALAANSQGVFTAQVATPTAAADWSCAYSLLAGAIGTGTVTSVQVAGAKGLSFSGGPITTTGTITASLTAPTVQSFVATGSQTGWGFTVSSANATVGATYTNNSNTYTVLSTIASGTLLFVSGTGATSGGTLTKATGSGDATITFSSKVASATYTTPGNVLSLKVTLVGGGGSGGGGNVVITNNVGGGGGGGASTCIVYITSPAASYPYVIGTGGSGPASATNGNVGLPSYFNAQTYIAGGGAAGTYSGGGGAPGGIGGVASGATLNINGNPGGWSGITGTTNAGGNGGSTSLGGGGAGATNAAGSAGSNYGGGGGGGSAVNGGGAGANGLLLVEEYYQ